MYYKTTILILALFIFSSTYSQEYIATTQKSYTSQPNSTSNGIQLNTDYIKYWSFGGGLGFSFWNDGTDILVAPKAYYNISPILITGVGLTYIYSDYKSNFSTYTSNSFGGSLFLAVRPIDYIQFSVEYEGLQTNRNDFIDEEYWNNSIYLGLSFISGPVSFGIRYDVLFDSNKSPYSSAVNPVIGFYF